MGCLFVLVLVVSLSSAWESTCAAQAGEDQRKTTKMDDPRNSEVTTLLRGQRATEQPIPDGDVFEIMGAYGRIRGVIDWKGKTRVYVKPAAADTIYVFDSEDLRTWKKSEKPEFPTEMALIHGKLKITSTQSVIPKKLHARAVTKEQVRWATNPYVTEVGQLTPHNRVIIRDGYAYIFYYYRDDIHYEGGWESQHESVNVYMMNEDHFDRLFE